MDLRPAVNTQQAVVMKNRLASRGTLAPVGTIQTV
ncbi:uncharacterized protein METZ01_LOCUS230322 [marine metagenome]|uniref:Uncharacterized protein n=1 Tax=marine metagenome TaxID=408172 RepID=A0A382GQU1_9ZZZZ